MNRVHSLEDLLVHLQHAPPPNSQSLTALNKFAPGFKLIDDFLTIFALTFGIDPTLIVIVWGSVRIILTPASFAGDTLQNVLDMLEELSHTLPSFGAYGDTLPLD